MGRYLNPFRHSQRFSRFVSHGSYVVIFLAALAVMLAVPGSYAAEPAEQPAAIAALAPSDSDTTPTVPGQSEMIAITGAIHGFVMDRVTSTVIQGAFIQLQGATELTTVTMTGRFELISLPPGDYTITGMADFYSTATVRLNLKPADSAGPIALRLEPLSGIMGYVVDSEGFAISDATVQVAYAGGRFNFQNRPGGAPEGQAFGRPTGPSDQCDVNGEFHISDISPDETFRLVVTHPQFADGDAGPFRLIPGQLESDVKIVLEAGGVIAGQVVDEDDFPISEVNVGNMRVEGQMRGGPAVARLAAAAVRGPDRGVLSDVDGRFELSNLSEGTHSVFARKDGYIYAFQDEIAVAKGQRVEDIKLVLRKGAVLSGVVQNSQEEPVSGARVTAMRFDRREPALDSAVTDDEGRFLMNSLIAGEYNVTVQAEGHPEFSVRNQAVPEEDVVYVLRDGGILRGRVTSASTEDPIREFSVVVSQMGRGGQFGFGGPGTNRHTFEDDDGRFEIKNLAEGVYNVEVRSRGYAPASRDRVRITESEVTEIEIAMTDGLALRGIVMRNRDRVPVAEALVEVRNDAEGGRGGPGGGGRALGSERTDALGVFEFTELLPGTYRLRVLADGFTEYTEQIVLAPQQDDDVMVYLRSGGVIAGRVINAASNEPIQGAQIAVTVGGAAGGGRGWGGPNPNAGGSAISGTDGGFVIDPVEEGKVNVRVTRRGFSTNDLTGLTVRSDETLNLGDIPMTGGGGIKGRVTNADGSPISGAFLMATGPSTNRNAQTRGDGSFEWDTLQAGEYTVAIVRLPGDGGRGNRGGFGQQARKTVTVEDGEVAQCDFQLQSGYKLTGYVSYAGEPANNWRVSYTRVSGGGDDIDTRNGTTQTNRQGSFEFSDLTNGQYLIVVHQRGNMAWGGGVTSVVEKTITISDSDADVELVIPESTVSGAVTDAESGRPIQGARVTILRSDTNVTADDILGGRLLQYRNTRTNGSGGFEFDNVTEGEWTVVAQHTNYSYALRYITVTAGDNVSGVNLSLTPGFSLTITALARATGIPVKSVSVMIYDSNGSLVREGNFAVDSLGKFIVTGLKEGRQMISGFSPYYAPVLNASVSIMPESDNHATLDFEDGGTLNLTVTDSSGQPVKGATVRILYGGVGAIGYPFAFRNQVNYALETVTNGEGKLRHEHLPSGYPTIEVTVPVGGKTASGSVQILNGQSSDLTISLN